MEPVFKEKLGNASGWISLGRLEVPPRSIFDRFKIYVRSKMKALKTRKLVTPDIKFGGTRLPWESKNNGVVI